MRTWEISDLRNIRVLRNHWPDEPDTFSLQIQTRSDFISTPSLEGERATKDLVSAVQVLLKSDRVPDMADLNWAISNV